MSHDDVITDRPADRPASDHSAAAVVPAMEARPGRLRRAEQSARERLNGTCQVEYVLAATREALAAAEVRRPSHMRARRPWMMSWMMAWMMPWMMPS